MKRLPPAFILSVILFLFPFISFTPVSAAEQAVENTIGVNKPVMTFGSLLSAVAEQVTKKPFIRGFELIKHHITASSVLGETAVPTRKAKKSAYTIALLGDSMIDTLGPTAPFIPAFLSPVYPRVSFTVRNFGVGGENILSGINRITNPYSYLSIERPSLVSVHPDVVVIESFGYNPFSYGEGSIDAHWLALAKAVDTIKNNLPNAKILIAATIAPNAHVFGDGADGLSFSDIAKWQKVDVIKKYLENTVKFAQSQNLPLADAYHPSLDQTGNGNLSFINPGDHIHYSDAGRAFFSRKIADAIIAGRLLE